MDAFTNCPNKDELQQHALLELDAEVAAQVQAHIDQCDLCSDTFNQLQHPQSDTASPEVLSIDEFAASGVAHDLIPPPVAETETPVLAETSANFAFLAPSITAGDLGSLGGYRILEVLGEGGMGIVFRAEDSKLQRELALKVIKPEFASHPIARARFLREAQAIAAIDDDHIVSIYQVSDDNVPYLAMPLLKGQTLSDRMRSGAPITIAESLRIAREVAQGLAAAHACGVIHRDVKPANIWLEQGSQRAKLLDFGLARPTGGDSELTSTGAIAGTPLYMAPEQVAAKEVDARVDLYSLGCVLYRMLTNKPPLSAPTPLATLSAIATERPRPLCHQNAQISEQLSALVMRLLEKTPDARPQSAAEVVAEIERIERDTYHPVQLRPAESSSRHWPAVVAAALLLGVGIALSAIIIRIRNRDGNDTVMNLLDEQVQSVTMEFAADNKGAEAIGRSSRAKTTAAETPPSIFDGLKPIPLPPGLMLEQGTPNIVAVLGDDRLRHWGPVLTSAFSPNGQQLATGGYDRTIRLWNTKTGELVRMLPGRDSEHPAQEAAIHWLAFSSDGKQLASGNDQSIVRIYDMETVKEVRMWRPPVSKLTDVMFDEDNHAIATGSRRGGEIAAWDAESGQQVGKAARLVLGQGQVLSALSKDRKTLAVVKGLGDSLGELSLVDVPTGETVATREANVMLSQPVAFTSDGKQCAAIVKGSVILIDSATGEEIRSFAAQAPVSVAISPDGRLLAAGGGYNTRVWELETGREIQSLPGSSSVVHTIAFAPDSKSLAVGSYDSTVEVWDIEPGDSLVTRSGHSGAVTCLAFSRDGQHLLTGSRDQSVTLWDLKDPKSPTRSPGSHEGCLADVLFSPDNRIVASASKSPLRSDKPGKVLLWDFKAGMLLNSLSTNSVIRQRQATALAFSSNGRRVVSCSDRAINIWDTEGAAVPRVIYVEEATVAAVAFTPDDQRIVAGCEDGKLRIFDATGTQMVNRDPALHTIQAHFGSVTQVGRTGNGSRFVSAGVDGRVVLWDVQTHNKVDEVGGPAAGILALAIDPIDSKIAWSSYGGWLQIWRPGSGPPETIIQISENSEHSTNHRIHDIVFSPDGRYLATANENATVYVMRVSN